MPCMVAFMTPQKWCVRRHGCWETECSFHRPFDAGCCLTSMCSAHPTSCNRKHGKSSRESHGGQVSNGNQHLLHGRSRSHKLDARDHASLQHTTAALVQQVHLVYQDQADLHKAGLAGVRRLAAIAELLEVMGKLDFCCRVHEDLPVQHCLMLTG